MQNEGLYWIRRARKMRNQSKKDFSILTESIFHLKPLQQNLTGRIVLYKPKTYFQIYKDSKYLLRLFRRLEWPPSPRTEVTDRIQKFPERGSCSAEAIKGPVKNWGPLTVQQRGWASQLRNRSQTGLWRVSEGKRNCCLPAEHDCAESQCSTDRSSSKL